jgi:hypothetical protein
MRPKDIAPKIFELAKRRNCTVERALENEWWVSNINLQNGLTMEHIVQFSNLWEELQHVQHDDATDSICWKFGKDDGYTASSAYKMQFLGHTNSAMTSMVWKPWAPPKCKTFAWLVIQNRVWTADRLHKRGGTNCGNCKLCNQAQESSTHGFKGVA